MQQLMYLLNTNINDMQLQVPVNQRRQDTLADLYLCLACFLPMYKRRIISNHWCQVLGIDAIMYMTRSCTEFGNDLIFKARQMLRWNSKVRLLGKTVIQRTHLQSHKFQCNFLAWRLQEHVLVAQYFHLSQQAVCSSI